MDPPRPNPELFEGSLIWWVEVPVSLQNHLQGVLEGHEGLGYYQTLDPCLRPEPEPVALGRITSTPDMREDLARLLRVLAGECGLALPGQAPAAFAPDERPRVRDLKREREGR